MPVLLKAVATPSRNWWAAGWFLENDVQPRGPQATIPHFEFKKTNET
jgi:hypothetical protein